jgi:hypothetical protein
MGDSGVPDWQDASAYPEGESITMREWWWEFTRRRPDYRELWLAAQPIENKTRRYAPNVDEFRLKFELSVIYNPRLQLSDWQLAQYRYPTNYGNSPINFLAEQIDHPHIVEAAARARHQGNFAEENGQMLYNFDLRKPLGPQLAHAESFLKGVQNEIYSNTSTRRPRKEKWRDYLRVLDARDVGATCPPSAPMAQI